MATGSVPISSWLTTRTVSIVPVTIPRLELTAALVSSKISCMLRQELEYAPMKEICWTVLGYINNDTRRFHVFDGNRVQEIREQSSPNQWHYVKMKSNPADIDCHSARAQELIDNPLWWNGPEFLCHSGEDWDSINDNPSIPPDDLKVKKVFARATQIQEPKLSSVLERLTYFSSWYRVKKAIAVCLWLQQKSRKTAGQYQVKEKNVKEQNKGITSYKPVDVKALQCAELMSVPMK